MCHDGVSFCTVKITTGKVVKILKVDINLTIFRLVYLPGVPIKMHNIFYEA